MSATLPAYIPLSSTPAPLVKPSAKPKPVNVFSNDGSFLERFQRSRQEEEDRRKAEEALAKKKQFADRFKARGKRPPPRDSSPAVTRTDLDANPAKKPKLGGDDDKRKHNDHGAPRGYQHRVPIGRIPKDTSSGPDPLIK